MFSLKVDYREKYVMEEMDKLSIPYKVDNLDIGDFQVVKDDDIIGIWERKTYNDLASSVSDNRYREQKHRLTTSEALYKGYIIEGSCPDPCKKYHNLHAGAIETIKIGLTCRDGFNVLYSTGATHTAILLAKLLKKIPEYLLEDRSMENMERKYHNALVKSSVSSIKKENYNQTTCYHAQLCQLPQVSVATAIAISGRWHHIGLLVASINEDRELTKRTLSDIKVGGKRIGDQVASKIIEMLIPLPKKVVYLKKN